MKTYNLISFQNKNQQHKHHIHQKEKRNISLTIIKLTQHLYNSTKKEQQQKNKNIKIEKKLLVIQPNQIKKNSMNYPPHLVNCTMDEPLQILMDRLSSKSSELYIFWQNYNQLYNLYQQKSNEILRLREEILILRKQNQQQPKVQLVEKEDNFIKERYITLQKNFDDLKLQNQKLKIECKQLRRQNNRFHDDNLQLQSLLQQLREQNNIQRQSIQKILNQLKNAQGELTSYSRLYEEIQQKDLQIAKLIENEKRMSEIIAEREEQIEELIETERQNKIKYETLLRQSMQNAKNKVMESLPNLIKTTKQKVQIVAN